jgi:hypothetical protein
MSAPAAPPPPPSGHVGLVSRVLDAILNVQDWHRAALLIVLGAAGLVGVIVYQGRDRLMLVVTAAFETSPKPRFSVENAQSVADELLLELPGATMVAVWSVDIERNVRSLLAFAGDAARTATVTASPRLLDRLRRGYPILRYEPGVNAPFIHVLNGEFWCGPPRPTMEEAPFYEAMQMQSICLQGVPPEAGVFLGLISVGFDAVMSPGHTEQLAPQLWDAAERLTQRAREEKS